MFDVLCGRCGVILHAYVLMEKLCRLLIETPGVNAVTNAYDLAGRLTRVQSGTGTRTLADVCGYGYEGICNLLFSAVGAATNTYAANALNQYTNILCVPASLRLDYDLDGSMLTSGVWAYWTGVRNREDTVRAVVIAA